MAHLPTHCHLFTTFAALILLLLPTHSLAGTVGVNWGRVADDLPDPKSVVSLLKSSSVTQVKLYDADPTVLSALANTNIKVAVALPNEQLYYAASRPSYALAWVKANIASHIPAGTLINLVSVGNEVFVDPNNLTNYLVPAMKNVHGALQRLNLDDQVKVSSPVALTALAASYPPSAGVFREELAVNVMKPMLELLKQTGSYLMVNVYPFFAYEANADVIPLDYALFRPNAGVPDGGSGLKYLSLFDAQMDAVFYATKKLGYPDIRVVVSETGWPSKGDEKETGAGETNAAAYNGNLVRRVLSGNAGTPLRPDAAETLDVYLFALFNENKKPGPTSERNYGLFYPTGEKVYDVQFRLGGQQQLQPKEAVPVTGSRKITTTPSTAPATGDVSPAATGGNGGVGGSSSSSRNGNTWCVANAAVGKERLQAALDYACGEGGADCKQIQPGSACFEPNTVQAHASFAFNSYYQKKGRVVGTCDFEGAGYVVTQQPQYGRCDFPTGY